MKRYSVVFLFVFLTSWVFAQSDHQEDFEDFSIDNDFRLGYKGIFEMAYQQGESERLKLDAIIGLQIGQTFSVGFGSGVRYYFDVESILIPLFADFRVNILKKPVTPYLSFEAGYTFNGRKNGGLLLAPTIGVSFKLYKSVINLGIGYEMQQMKYTAYNPYWYSSSPTYHQYTKNMDAISFVIGIHSIQK